MKRPYRYFLATSFMAFFAAILSSGMAGCSDDGGGRGACLIDPPGRTFTFHVHNGGSKMLRLTYGCGAELPIQLDTQNGAAEIGSGDCSLKCEDVYDGVATTVNPGCADCGPGMGEALAPGATVDIVWDRRVYIAHTIDGTCGDIAGTNCALAEATALKDAHTGVLRVCADGKTPEDIGGVPGFCSGEEQMVNFTVNTLGDEATIEVQ
jgi:hypothetical protein